METTPLATALVLDLGDADASLASSLGGKGANLARMIQADLPVPPAFAVTAEAFRSFLAGSELGPLFLGADEAGTEDLLASLERTGWSRKETFERLQDAIRTAGIPGELAREIAGAYEGLGRGKVAVRSSGTDEDSASASFAGQYDTFLSIEGDEALLSAVRKCWASVASYRSYVYRKQGGISPAELAIAVVVQRMVPAEASGVLFTADPVGGGRDRMVVEAGWGLGEGIVNGQVATDSYVVEKGTLRIISRVVRYKLRESAARPDGGTSLALVPQDRRDRPALCDERVVELARLATRVRDLFGREQDVEWAASDGRLFLLQARPITAPAAGGPALVDADPEETDPSIRAGTLWSMMDTGEATTGIMTPLSQDFMLYYRDEIHPKCLRVSGIWDVSNNRPAVGYFQGRCYLNVSHLAHKFSQIPLFKDPMPLLRRFSSEEVDVEKYRTPYPSGARGLAAVRATLYWLSQQWRLLLWKRARRKAEERRAARYAEFAPRDLTRLSSEELAREIEKALALVDESGLNYFPFYFVAFAAYDALTQLCKKFLPGEGLEQKLKADVSELRTIDVTTDLWQLAEKAKADPEVRRILRETPPAGVKDALLSSERGRTFWKAAVEPLLARHGVRGKPPEMEFMNLRWADDPTLLFAMARTYVEKDFKVEDVLAKGEKDRSRFTREALARLPWAKRKALGAVVRLYYVFGETREITRMWAMCETWALQRLIRELGRRMVEKGILRSVEEIAFVPFRDLAAFASGAKTPADFPRSKIEANRRAHLQNLRVPDPPLTIVGPYDPSRRLIVDEAATDVLSGVGTSPGHAEGRARVVLDVDAQAAEFQPGEVLVAHFTNATWTPLFITAAAVVVDLGSVLAHSAIVAREYGIPCVANTLVATRAIRTGDRVIVDGDAGKVRIERRG
ncbi:MAG: phosphoenolpyruvate-utilizing enzyme [Planctomycetes bacterium]|nr:phosphoenolpyruvate-utilizing enzyme [Planctomycetota bacterium]